jgi:ankyrin repeat protein
LHLFCQKYQDDNLIEIIQLLIQHGIDVNCKTNAGSNALTLLCEFYQKENLIEIIQLLIHHGIDINCKNTVGQNALVSLCLSYEKENEIEVHCENESAINSLSKNSKKGNVIEIIEFLIQQGNDVNCKDDYGNNALLSFCRHYQKENLVEIILFFN